MKFEDMPDSIQLVAAQTVSQYLLNNPMSDDLAISVTDVIRKAFINLYKESSVEVVIGDVEIKTT